MNKGINLNDVALDENGALVRFFSVDADFAGADEGVESGKRDTREHFADDAVESPVCVVFTDGKFFEFHGRFRYTLVESQMRASLSICTLM